VFALIVLSLACSALAVSASTPSPGQLVQVNSERMMQALNDRRAEFQSHPEALHRFIQTEFSQSFDRVYAARLVMGDSPRKASDADLQAFADALSDHLLARYGSSLLKIHTGLGVKVVSEVALREGTIVKVRSLVDRTNGVPMQVDYLVHRHAGQWQVFDVIVEGISFVQTFRYVFADVVRSKPLAEVTADLRAGKILTGAVATDQVLHKP
jgi:phospholipid transport system substrate-binding protein